MAAVSDAKAYVFSADEIRHAPEAVVQSFSASVAEFQAAAAPEKKGAGEAPTFLCSTTVWTAVCYVGCAHSSCIRHRHTSALIMA